MKNIKIIYETNEHLFVVNPSIPLEQFLNQLKIHFGISADVSFNLVDIDTDTTLIPVSTNDLWYDKELPTYKIYIGKSNEIYNST